MFAAVSEVLHQAAPLLLSEMEGLDSGVGVAVKHALQYRRAVVSGDLQVSYHRCIRHWFSFDVILRGACDSRNLRLIKGVT